MRQSFPPVDMPSPTIPHPSADELVAFAQGALVEPRSSAVEVHVGQCEPCASVVAAAPNDALIEQLQQSRHSVLGGGAGQRQATPFFPDEPKKGSNLSRGSGKEEHPRADRDGLAQLPKGLREHPRYEFKKHLATGAMGEVYLAFDRPTAKLVAVKVFKPELAGKPGRKNRFFQETRIAMRLRHPNIAQVLHEALAQEGNGAGATSAAIFFAMEYVEGETLAELVARQGPLPVVQAADYVRQAASGLQYAHEMNVVHRDIKPHNIMLQRQTGRIKILDFGLGRLVDEQRSGTRLTKEGEILGTLGYLSPEQAANARETDIRSDIYSLGCTFFFLLTGHPPFRSHNAVELLNMHLKQTPAPIRSLRPDVPAEVAALQDRMLAKEPSQRPQSPREVAEALAIGKSPSHGAESARIKDPTRAEKIAGGERGPSALIRTRLSPAVVLPILTLLICLIWLLISTFR